MNALNLFCRLTAWLLVVASTSMALAADSGPDAAALVRPWIGETSALIVRLDPTRLALPDLAADASQTQTDAQSPEQRWGLIAETIKNFQTLTGGQPVYASIGIPVSHTQWPVFFFLQETPEVDRQRLRDDLRAFGIELGVEVREGMLFLAPDGILDLPELLDTFTSSPRAGLDEALASVASYPIQILLLPPDYVRRTVVELMPQLPRHLGGGSSDVLTQGLRWAALGLEPAELRTTLIVQSDSPQAAQRLADRVPVMLQSIHREAPGLQQRVDRKTVETLTSLFQPVVQDDRIVFRIGDDQPLPAHLQVWVAAMIDSIEDRLRGQDGSDRVTGPVSGRVSLDGRPLAEGKLVLHPPDGPPIEIDITDGAFATEALPIAEMRVVIQGEGVPESFGRKETTALVVETKEEANRFDFELRR